MIEMGANEKMLMYAARFDFPSNTEPPSTVVVERVYDFDRSYYWTIKVGNSRWSRKYQMFVQRGEKERSQVFINDTKYTLDEAYEMASNRDLWAEHLEKMILKQKVYKP